MYKYLVPGEISKFPMGYIRMTTSMVTSLLLTLLVFGDPGTWLSFNDGWIEKNLPVPVSGEAGCTCQDLVDGVSQCDSGS